MADNPDIGQTATGPCITVMEAVIQKNAYPHFQGK